MKNRYIRSSPEHNSTFNVLIFFGLLVIGAAVYFAFIGPGSDISGKIADKKEVVHNDTAGQNERDIPAEFVLTLPDNMAQSENEFPSGKILAGNSSLFLEFNKADYETAFNENKLIILYFYSRWCYTCRTEAIEALYPAFDELNNEKVVGFHINLNDNEVDEEELKITEKNSVFYQNTKIFMKNGLNVLSSFETWDKERYLSEIAKLL